MTAEVGAEKATAKRLIIIVGGGVCCEHAMRAGDQEQDIVVVCEECAAASRAGVEVAVTGKFKDSGKRLESVCPNVFRLIQLPFEDGGAKWVQQGNTILCVDCAKKQTEVAK